MGETYTVYITFADEQIKHEKQSAEEAKKLYDDVRQLSLFKYIRIERK